MKTKVGFNLRQVCGENIIVAEGEENIDFSNIISMNESSAFLWREAQKLDNFTVADLVKILTSEYEVDEATATADVLKLTNQWGVAGILEGDDIPVLKVEKNENEPANTLYTTSLRILNSRCGHSVECRYPIHRVKKFIFLFLLYTLMYLFVLLLWYKIKIYYYMMLYLI